MNVRTVWQLKLTAASNIYMTNFFPENGFLAMVHSCSTLLWIFFVQRPIVIFLVVGLDIDFDIDNVILNFCEC